MTRLTRAWAAMTPERRLAAAAAIGLLVTMFLPWYGLQSTDRKTGAIYSHNISAFGDVSFVEAAIFLVAAGVIALLFARAEGRNFDMPGGDGTIVLIAGCWAALLIFYRVFDRPSGHGYPVGIEWGFFLAFVAAGALAYAGLRMRRSERPAAPARRRTARQRAGEAGPAGAPQPDPRPPVDREDPDTLLVRARGQSPRGAATPAPAPAGGASNRSRGRPRFPPAPARGGAGGAGAGATEPEQLSFEDQLGED